MQERPGTAEDGDPVQELQRAHSLKENRYRD